MVAGAVGNAWTALIQIAFVPLYIALLGVEAYGLIGAFAFVLALFGVLDAGMGQAVSREAARGQAGARDMAALRGLVRTIEILVACAGLCLVALVAAGADAIVELWLRIDSLERPSVEAAFMLLAIQVVIRLLVSLYRAILAGAQAIVWLSAAGMGFATLRGAGVLPVLFAWPHVEAFFAFQVAVTALEALVFGRKAWNALPGHSSPRFSPECLGEVGRFGGGATLASLLLFFIAQGDRAVLSATIELADFGAYVLCASLAGSLASAFGPFVMVGRLRLNKLAALADERRFADGFHHFAQWTVLAGVPMALVLAIFAEPVLYLWTRNEALSATAAPLLGVLSLCGLFNACSAMPYAVALAHGRSRNIVRVNAAALALYLPTLFVASSAYGALAAAVACVAVMALQLFAAPMLLLAHLPAREVKRWLTRDVLAPVASAACAAGVVRLGVPSGASGLAMACWIAIAYAAALAATAPLLPFVRRSWRVDTAFDEPLASPEGPTAMTDSSRGVR